MTTTTLPTTDPRNGMARELCAPRGGRARSAVGRRSSLPAPAAPDAPSCVRLAGLEYALLVAAESGRVARVKGLLDSRDLLSLVSAGLAGR
jgi:hypothetical protein